MANNDQSKPHTLDDLKKAMENLKFAEGDYKNAMDRVKAASDALRSHQGDADKADQLVQQRKADLRKVLSNLEKI
jgi:hypothetical protein